MVGMGNFTEFGNIAGVSCAHLQNKYLMVGLQSLLMTLQIPIGVLKLPGVKQTENRSDSNGGQGKFGAGFAITAGDTDDGESGHGSQFLLGRPGNKSFLDVLFNGFGQKSGQQYPKRNHDYPENPNRGKASM